MGDRLIERLRKGEHTAKHLSKKTKTSQKFNQDVIELIDNASISVHAEKLLAEMQTVDWEYRNSFSFGCCYKDFNEFKRIYVGVVFRREYVNSVNHIWKFSLQSHGQG